MRVLASYAIEKKHITAKIVSADKSVHKARGPLWHKKDRQKNVMPKNLRGVDRESKWGLSPYHGWVQGYAQHTVVNATPGEARFPIDCTAGTANMAENHVFTERVELLPKNTRKAILDGTYDDEKVFAACRPQRIHPIVPPMARPVKGSSEIRVWAFRINCRANNRALYSRRRTTIEPNFGNGKRAFENHRVWFYGLSKNKTHLVMVNYVRALAMLVNFETGYPPENIQELLDAWQ